MKQVVLFYPHIEEYGGIERNLIGLAINIRKNGFRPVLLCFYDRIKLHTYEGEIEVVQLGESRNPLLKALRLRRWLQQYRSQQVGLPLFFSGKAGFYAAMPFIRSYPYALHFTDPMSLLKGGERKAGAGRWWNRSRKRFADWLIGQGVKKATCCLTMTHWNAQELQQDYQRDFQVIYQGGVPPLNIEKRENRCRGTTLNLFSICRLTYSKNLDWILYTAKALLASPTFHRSYDSLRVIIAGKGPELASLQKLSEELGLAAYTQFPGFLDPMEAEEAFHQADLFLVPGKQGFGLPILEALYRGVPVVQNRESRISEMLEGNPWVAIAEDDREAFTQQVFCHIKQIREHYPNASWLNELMTEDKWAQEIGKRCAWWSN